MHKATFNIESCVKVDVMTPTYNSTTQEVEMARSEVQGYHHLHSQLEDRLNYRKPPKGCMQDQQVLLIAEAFLYALQNQTLVTERSWLRGRMLA